MASNAAQDAWSTVRRGVEFRRSDYLFANARGTRMKLVVHDGFGVWCATRRLNQGRFLWPRDGAALPALTREQFEALVLGLPWQRLEQMKVITRV